MGFFPLSDSTYLIESFPSFYIIDDHGSVLNTTNIPNKLDKIFGNKYNDNLYISSEMSHSVRINRHEYVLQVYRPNLNINENYPQYPLFVKLKIDESLNIEISPIDIYFPEEFKLPGGLTFGQHERAVYSIQNNHIIYGFGFSSKVFIYNINNKTMISIDLEIKNGINFSAPEATNIILSGNRLLTNFNIPLIDFNTNTIYRFHIDIDEENPMDNQGYLTVFDLDGRKLIESSLGKNSERMLRNPFLLNGKVFVNPYYPKTMEEHLEFYNFKLTKK
ncbi:hypothetical protein [Negadavirga shengliensis]|uniref:Uncharacterized protein n=1 Tax=Negadavirga shengliensis TaxID=1389218 RepID=A0ABV9T3X8_9BACT